MAGQIWVRDGTAFLSLEGIDVVSELYISYPAAWSDPFVGILPFSPQIFTVKADLLVAVPYLLVNIIPW